MSSVSSRSAEKGCGDNDSAEIPGGIHASALLVEPIWPRGILLSIEVDSKEAVSSSVKSKFWTAWEWVSSKGDRCSDVKARDSNSCLMSHELLATLNSDTADPCSRSMG